MPSDAINVLYDIKAATFKNAAALPRKEESQAQWQGLGFLVGGTRLVSKIGDVVELLQMPKLTPLPAVKSWVRGIANIRGRLVPIVDLHEFLEMPTTMPASQWRLLIVEDEDVVAGLLVEQSLGIQHFSEESFEAHDGEGLAGLQPFAEGAFRHGGRVFHEVHLKAILRDERFFDVAQDKSK
ncbi:MAG: chemotaxis protein CheW [Pseudomonadales bacterium]|nr:chemotaxis protein CheW [Pseudomonadales bacterium]